MGHFKNQLHHKGCDHKGLPNFSGRNDSVVYDYKKIPLEMRQRDSTLKILNVSIYSLHCINLNTNTLMILNVSSLIKKSLVGLKISEFGVK